MVGSRLWRIIRTGIFFVAAVVVALNIENLAVFFGWDNSLVSFATYVPVQLQRVWDVITAPTILVSSIAVLAFAAGMQWDRFQKYQRTRQIGKPENRESMAQWWEKVAYAIEVSAELYDTYRGVTDGIEWQLRQIQERTKYYTGVKFNYRDRNKAEALELSQFLKRGAVQIRKEDFGDLRQMIVSYNEKLSTAKKLELPPQNENPSL
jgi:hypothetical protein